MWYSAAGCKRGCGCEYWIEMFVEMNTLESRHLTIGVPTTFRVSGYSYRNDMFTPR